MPSCRSKYRRLAELPAGARVGTSSPRRQAQLQAARPDLAVELLRGNVDTRLARLEDGALDAILLACAGLERLGLADRITEVLDAESFVPAVGQGVIGIECATIDAASQCGARGAARSVHGAAPRGRARLCAATAGQLSFADRRACLRSTARRCGCRAFIGAPDGREAYRDRISGPAAQAADLGRRARRPHARRRRRRAARTAATGGHGHAVTAVARRAHRRRHAARAPVGRHRRSAAGARRACGRVSRDADRVDRAGRHAGDRGLRRLRLGDLHQRECRRARGGPGAASPRERRSRPSARRRRARSRTGHSCRSDTAGRGADSEGLARAAGVRRAAGTAHPDPPRHRRARAAAPELERRGAAVQVAELYRRVPVTPSPARAR